MRWTDLKLLSDHRSELTTIKVVPELVQALLSNLEQFVFRGQASFGWQLDTRLHRTFPTNTVTNELRVRQLFSSDARAYIPPSELPQNEFDWDALLQHHGGPTRLMDWSQSPFVALYFATELNGDDGAVWMLDRQWATEKSLASLARSGAAHSQWKDPILPALKYASEHAVACLFPFTPSLRFPRMVAQMGLFTYVGGADANATQALLDVATSTALPPTGRVVLRKIRIPSPLKAECRRTLEAMGISGATLFPGLDGLAQSVASREWLDWYTA